MRRLAASVLLYFSFVPRLIGGEVLIPTDKVAGGGDARFYLLAVGVAKYTDDFWPALKWPAEDAKKIAEALGKDTNAQRQVTLLTDQQATRGAVLKALKAIRQAATARDTVVVYVSSHGTLAEGDGGDLEKVVVLADTTKDLPAQTGLGHKDVTDWLESLPARRKLLIFATCHSGVGKSKLSPRVERLLGTTKGVTLAPLADVSEGALILAAAAKGEAAREDDRLGGDVYTHYFLEGLSTYDRNGDGVVTAMEAHDYAKEKTYAFTRGRQRPTAEARFIGDADVPLRGVKTSKGVPVLEAYDEGLAGFQVQVDGGVKGRLPMAFPLDAGGKSRISLYAPQSGKRLADYQVSAGQGERLTLEQVMAPPPLDFGISAGQEEWSDAKFARLIGRTTLPYTEVEAKYHWYDLYGGAAYRLEQHGQNQVRPALGVKTKYDAALVYAGYEKHLGTAWHVYGQLGSGREWLHLEFSEAGGDALPYDGVSTLYTGQLGFGREFAGGLDLSLKAGRSFGKYAFPDLGSFGANRTLYGLGLNFRFGGVATRL